MQNLKKKIQRNLFTKQKQTHRFRERTSGYRGGEGWGEGIVRGFGIDMYTLLCFKIDDQQGPIV